MSRPGSERPEPALTAWTALCALGLLAYFGLPLWKGGLFAVGDIADQNLPVRHFYAQALRHGDSFLWHPGLFGGFYLHGEGQGGLLHPFHYLLYRFLPLETAFNLELWLAQAFMLAGAVLLLRRLGFAPLAAFPGGAAIAFCISNSSHYGHMNGIEGVAHLPWLLWAGHRVLTGFGRRALAGSVAALALLLASALLLGYAFYVVCSLLCLGGLVSWLAVAPPDGAEAARRARSRLPALALALVCGTLLGAPQWQPARDALGASGRAETDFLFRMSYSNHPAGFLSVVSPFALRQGYIETPLVANRAENYTYLGAVVLLALLWGALRGLRPGPWRGLVIASLLLAGMMCLWSLGYYGIVYRFVSALPVLKHFRCPGRYLLLTQFAGGILTAFLFQDLLALAREPSRRRWRARDLLLLAPLAGSLAVVAAALLAEANPAGHPWLAAVLHDRGPILWGAEIFSAATLLLFLAAHGGRWALYPLALLLVGDLGLSWSVLYVRAIPLTPLSRVLAEIPAPPGAPGERALSYQYSIRPLMREGWRLGDGYAGLFPRKFLPLRPDNWGPFDPANERSALRLASVRWTRPRRADGLIDTTRWEEVPDALPRARLVARAVNILPNDAVPTAVKGIDIARVALTETPVDVVDGPAGSARIAVDRPGRIEIETEAAGRQLLVVSESYHAGWQARVDGARAPAVRVYGDWLGVPVEAGAHRVALRFAPQSLATGLWLGAVGAVLLVALVGWSVKSNRP